MLTSDGTTTTVYIGNYFEWNVQIGTMTKYYYAGAERLAMRSGAGAGTTGLVWIVGDHLGSTSITVDAATGAKLSELRYKPWGEARYEWGVTGTKYKFTGQHEETDGLYFYGARFYDSYITHFSQPDTLVPDQYNPLDWNRYGYARYNPVKYKDPSGHYACGDGIDDPRCDQHDPPVTPTIPKKEKWEPWRFSKDIDLGYNIGWTPLNVPAQSSDDFLAEAYACSLPTAGFACIAALISRFAFVGPQNNQTNFWVHFMVAYDESLGITITNFTISQNTGENLEIPGIVFSSGDQAFEVGPTGLSSGFGGDLSIPNPPTYNGNNPLNITIRYKQTVDLGSAPFPGPYDFYPKINISLPSLPELRYFLNTGQFLPAFP